MSLPRARTRTLASLLALAAAIPAAAQAMPSDFGSWSSAVRVEEATGADETFNGPGLDGCPFISRDGLTFYMASNRPGGVGGLDIWVSTRASEDDPWGAPVNLGAPVNSPSNDFCPTISRNDHRFYFVSNRPGGCGGADIYVTQRRNKTGFEQPENVGCDVNSSADEASPMPIPERGEGPSLYFSSVRPGGYAAEAPGAAIGDSDLYVSRSHGGAFGPAQLVPGANTASEDGQPNVRRDGLELFFYSNRPGTLGSNDIYSASRESTSEAWSTPANLGPSVNSALGSETRPSLSWDGTTLYFGSTRPGGDGNADHYVTTRERVVGAR